MEKHTFRIDDGKSLIAALTIVMGAYNGGRHFRSVVETDNNLPVETLFTHACISLEEYQWSTNPIVFPNTQSKTEPPSKLFSAVKPYLDIVYESFNIDKNAELILTLTTNEFDTTMSITYSSVVNEYRNTPLLGRVTTSGTIKGFKDLVMDTLPLVDQDVPKNYRSSIIPRDIMPPSYWFYQIPAGVRAVWPNFNFLAKAALAKHFNLTPVSKDELFKEYKFVFEVTAADFNGEDFDGLPIVAIHGDRTELQTIKSQLDKIKNVWSGSTDYAVWEVPCARGVIIAEPGDLIVTNGYDLDVIRSTRLIK